VGARGGNAQADACIEVPQRRPPFAPLEEGCGHELMSRGVAGIDGEKALKGVQRLVMALHRGEEAAKVEQERRVGGLKLNGAPQGDQSVFVAPESVEHEAEIVVRLGVAGCGLERLVQPFLSFRGITALKAENAEETQGINLNGVACQDLPIQRFGVGKAASLMQRYGGPDSGGG
jgi:hypothetical protein